MEQLFRAPLQPYPAQQCHCIRPEAVPASQGCPIRAGRERDEMTFAFLCLTSLLCKWGCKTRKKSFEGKQKAGMAF